MAALARYEDLAGRGAAAGVPAEQGAQAPGQGPRAGQLAQGPRPRVVPAGPRRPLHRAARHRPARPADRGRLRARLRLELRQPRRRPGPAGRRLVRRRPVRRSRSRPCAARRRTARAATSPAAGATAGWCCARPRRPCRRTRRRWPTSTGTASAPPTTSGSTCAAMKHALDVRQGVLGLPLIRNVKHVDPADPSTPEVIQIETAMGAAIEVFEGSALIEVGRDRFVPVKTTNDLLVLRSDVYDLGDRLRARPGRPSELPFVDLDGDYYKLRRRLRQALPRGGAVAAARRRSLSVDGDWTFGHGVEVVGDVDARGVLRRSGSRPARVLDGPVMGSRMATTCLGRRAPRPRPRRGRAAAGLPAAADGDARAGGRRGRPRDDRRCPRSTTPRWTGTPCASATSPTPATSPRCTCRSSARSAPARPSCSRCRPARRSRS